MNSREVCQDIFTRVNNKNMYSSEMSVLDYVFVTTDPCSSSISSMIIDEELLYTPWCNPKKSKRYIDHNAMIFPLPRKREEIPTSILFGPLMILMDEINLGRLLKMIRID